VTKLNCENWSFIKTTNRYAPLTKVLADNVGTIPVIVNGEISAKGSVSVITGKHLIMLHPLMNVPLSLYPILYKFLNIIPQIDAMAHSPS
jgi:hypothetical protein